jgi:hypothetical protein
MKGETKEGRNKGRKEQRKKDGGRNKEGRKEGTYFSMMEGTSLFNSSLTSLSLMSSAASTLASFFTFGEEERGAGKRGE